MISARRAGMRIQSILLLSCALYAGGPGFLRVAHAAPARSCEAVFGAATNTVLNLSSKADPSWVQDGPLKRAADRVWGRPLKSVELRVSRSLVEKAIREDARAEQGFKRGVVRTAVGSFNDAAKIGFINYLRDLRSVGPARVLFRPAAKFEGHGEKAGGFLTHQLEYYYGDGRVFRALKRTWQFVPRRFIGGIRGEDGHLYDLVHGDPHYVFSYFKGLKYSLLDAPIYSLSGAAKLKRRYVSSMLLSGAALIGGSVGFNVGVVQPILDARNERVIAEALENTIDVHRADLERLVQYDVRNRDLRDLWMKTVPFAATPAERKKLEDSILETAQIRTVSNRSFFEKYSEEKFVATRESVAELVLYPQFVHLHDFAAKDADKPFDAMKWETVFYLNWTFQLMTELAPEFVSDSTELRDAMKNPVIKDAHDKVFSGSYMESIRELHRQRRLTRDEAAYYVGQGLYYRTRIAEAKVLAGLTMGATIQDVERELLARAIQLHSMPAAKR